MPSRDHEAKYERKKISRLQCCLKPCSNFTCKKFPTTREIRKYVKEILLLIDARFIMNEFSFHYQQEPYIGLTSALL